MGREIKTIVIHCAATANGRRLARQPGVAAGTIDVWHSQRGFRRTHAVSRTFNPSFKSIGYHYVIDTDGRISTGRHHDETGAHARGYNANSLGVCLVGTDQFTLKQWHALSTLVSQLRAAYPDANITGHRDLSPDKNRDGRVTPDEWTKTCPGFDVASWVRRGMPPLQNHIFER